MKNIRLTKKTDRRKINNILDEAFGPGRLAKSVYRYREYRTMLEDFSYIYEEKKNIYASISYFEISLNKTSEGLLLGPLVVKPEYKGKGFGKSLVDYTIKEIKNSQLYDFIILIGELEYYQKFGFERVKQKVKFIGPVNPEKILILILNTKIKLSDDDIVNFS